LYQCGEQGATFEQLRNWAAPKMRGNLKRTLDGLLKKCFLHHNGESYLITLTGQKEVEKKNLVKNII
jgi:hypothetical protein